MQIDMFNHDMFKFTAQTFSHQREKLHCLIVFKTKSKTFLFSPSFDMFEISSVLSYALNLTS